MNNRNENLIFRLLEIAVKKDELSEYMLLSPGYSISSRDSNVDEQKALDYYSWEALYKFAKKYPKVPIGDLISKALIHNASYKGEDAIMATLSFIEYNYRYVKKRIIKPFDFDAQPVLDELRVTILDNKEIYTQKKSCFNEPFWNYIEEHSDTLKKEFGLKLI